MTTGDRSDSPPWDVAQRLDNHLGKVIHITPDGAPAPDNPFIGKPGVLPEIWAYGVRSPEGLTFDPKTGRLWQVDHGPRGGDELNIIEKGKNYGWPVIVHGIDYPGTAIGEGITHKEGMEEPVYYWDPVIAPSGLAFYTGNLFPQWKTASSSEAARHDARPVDDRERQGRGGRTVADGSACPDSRCSGRAGRRGVCPDRQRHLVDEPEHAAHQQIVEAHAEIAAKVGSCGFFRTAGVEQSPDPFGST
jgi:hypothetical protein